MPESAIAVEKALVCLCGGSAWKTVFTYDRPPEGEVQFQFSATESYHRQVVQCRACGHFRSVHAMKMSQFYQDEYMSATYGDDGIRRAFDRINALEPSTSDNIGRVNRLLEFSTTHFAHRDPATPRTVLDVGSGLCVFLHRMKMAGWVCAALDPDPRAAAHARHVVGVDAVCGDFLTVRGLGVFDVLTFNKVLEHVKDPVAMLKIASTHVKPDGFVYVEVPDGECAALDGPGREEFFIDHWHIFSAVSLALLASRAGFSLRALGRLKEPSTKYTLRAFLAPQPSPPRPTCKGMT